METNVDTPRFQIPSIQPVSGTVFQYTDGRGLIGMVRGQEIFASEASGMNDHAELRQGRDLVQQMMTGQRGDFASKIQDFLIRDHPLIPDRREVFVVSASTRGDDANQWRNYADGGKGYAIEFDTQEPLAVLTKEPAPTSDRPYARILDWAPVSPWLPVIYGSDNLRTTMNDLMEQYAALDPSSVGEDVAWGETALAFSSILSLYKSEGYSGESEVRLLANFNPDNRHGEFRPGRYGVVHFAKLVKRRKGQEPNTVARREKVDVNQDLLPIRSIRLGPLLAADNTETIETLLKSSSYDNVPVQTSAVPLR